MPAPRTLWTAFLAAAALTAVVYGRGLSYDLVYDDVWTIVRNPSLTQGGPGRFFTDPSTVSAPGSGMGRSIYRPLPTLSFAVNRRLAGLAPWTWRVADLLLHALNGALVGLLLLRVLGLSAEAATLGAALFLVHPVQVESVVWVTQRSNLMCAAGGLASLLLLAEGNAWGLAAYALALLSKETAVTLLPFLLLVLPRSGADRRRKWGLAAGSVLLVAGYLVLRHFVVGALAQRPWRGGFLDNLLIGQASWLEYVRLLLWPARLAASHLQYVDNPWEHPAPWIGVAATLLWMAALLILRRRSAGRTALALAWIPATLAPHLGLFPLDTFVAERFLYLPAAGGAALGALLFDFIGEKTPARKALVFLPALLAALSFRQTAVWRNDLTLWRAAVAAEPANPFARLSLAESHYVRGRLPEAAQATRDALTCNPSAHLAFTGLNNLSDMALKEHRPGAALRFADKALRIRPDSAAARGNRDKALEQLKNKTPAKFPPRAHS